VRTCQSDNEKNAKAILQKLKSLRLMILKRKNGEPDQYSIQALLEVDGKLQFTLSQDKDR
jgi:hypothetical protein